MDRKKFIKTSCFACIGLTGFSIILESCSNANYYAISTIEANKITVKKSEFIKLNKGVETFRKYVIIKTEKLNFPICLFKNDAQTYSALLMECTHNSCELQPHGDYLICPCHGSEFSNKGIVQNPPAEENLKFFKTITYDESINIFL